MKRITSLDFLRGASIFFATVFHVMFTSWDKFADPGAVLSSGNIPLIILAIVIVFFIHWRGFFLMISAVVNFYQMMAALKKGTPKKVIFWRQVVGGLVVMVFGKIWMTFMAYWGAIELWSRGSGFTLVDRWDLFYMIEAIESIGIMMIVLAFFFLLFTAKSFKNRTWLNVTISLLVALAIIIVSPYLSDAITVLLGGLDLTIGENFRTFVYPGNTFQGILERLVRIPLNWLVGREAPLFPMAGSFFIGTAIALILHQDQPTKRDLKWMFLPLTMMIVLGVLDLFLITTFANFDPAFHVHPRWYALLVNGMQGMVVIGLLLGIEFNPKLKQERWLKYSRYFRRIGVFALTVYFFNIMDFVPRLSLNLIFKALNIETGQNFISRYGMNALWTVFLMVIVLLLWSLYLFVLDRGLKGYLSLEYLMSMFRKPQSGIKASRSDPLNLMGILHKTEMVTYWTPSRAPEETK